MFERFWRGMRGQIGNPIPGDERRTHPRHEANLETTCRLVSDSSSGLRVRVRNVSRGGINFLVERKLEPGTLLRIDLPQGAGDEASVLACVMHASLQSDGKFSIGCSFSDELGDADLNEFGAHKELAPTNDKRSWMRYSAHGQAEYLVLPPTGEPAKHAEIANISPNGIGLLVNDKIQPGTMLDLLLKTKSGRDTFDVLACVVFLGNNQEGGWVIGCHFIRELEEKDLKLLV